MRYEPWMLAAMEEEGIMDTHEGHINRVAKYIRESGMSYIGDDELSEACRECDIDPDSFDMDDIREIERKANL